MYKPNDGRAPAPKSAANPCLLPSEERLRFIYYTRCKHPRHGDLLPAFRTSPSMISDEGKGKGYVEEQAHGSGDDWSAETTGGGAESGGCGAGSGSIEAHDLCLEGEVRRHGCKPGAGSQAVAG